MAELGRLAARFFRGRACGAEEIGQRQVQSDRARSGQVCEGEDLLMVVRGSQYVVRSTWFAVRSTWFVVRSTWFVVDVVRSTWFVVRGSQYVVRSTRFVSRHSCLLSII